jgi:putative nucleotidyltransferase with HDIG domain
MITPVQAEKFTRELYAKHFKGDDLSWSLLHLQNVANCCKLLAEGKDVDNDALTVSAWLHDLGRTQVDEGHAQVSVEIAEKEFGKLDPIVKDCIAHHGSKNETPTTEEGKIIQIADKLSVLDPRLFIREAREDKEKAVKRLHKTADKLAELIEKNGI